MPQPYTSLRQYFRDVTIGFALFVAATIVSGLLCHFLTPNQTYLYGFWFALSLVPFVLFARSRGVLWLDFVDIVALLTVALVGGFVANAVQQPAWGAATIPIAIVVGSWLWIQIRCRFIPRRRRSDGVGFD